MVLDFVSSFFKVKYEFLFAYQKKQKVKLFEEPFFLIVLDFGLANPHGHQFRPWLGYCKFNGLILAPISCLIFKDFRHPISSMFSLSNRFKLQLSY